MTKKTVSDLLDSIDAEIRENRNVIKGISEKTSLHLRLTTRNGELERMRRDLINGVCENQI